MQNPMVHQTKTVFANPMFNIPFRMLFANESRRELLISLIDSLFDFHGEDRVNQVNILWEDLYSDSTRTIIGIRCCTIKNKDILVELQMNHKFYSLKMVLFERFTYGVSHKFNTNYL
ncbi:unnamed protein product [Brachionus calyciflorus]|uniref:Uncharacterized protein n=1 Tax=Brachionus calyciflorus TaxID=104777 RepID=A0A814P5P0_9BILA|nr:unnamed protein product [Brachionus calyciflorus]